MVEPVGFDDNLGCEDEQFEEVPPEPSREAYGGTQFRPTLHRLQSPGPGTMRKSPPSMPPPSLNYQEGGSSGSSRPTPGVKWEPVFTGVKAEERLRNWTPLVKREE